MGLPKRMPRSRPVTQSADEDKRVIVNRYRAERKLGCGNFGTAFLVKDLKCKDPNDEWKVLKEIPVGTLQPDETVDAMHEAKLLSKLDYEGIVKFHDSFVDGEYVCIVTEYCEGGDLDDYISMTKKQGAFIEEERVMDWIVQLLSAVDYMHTKKVLHRDLKTRNIFLKSNWVKVGDFGISRILMGTADMATTFTGTPYYMAPEVLKHEGYNSKSDVWSVGCVLYELCEQKHAFQGESLMGVMYKIVEGATPCLSSDKYSPALNSLLSNMLTKDPTLRPSASDLLRLDYVAKHIKKMRARLAEQKSPKQTSDTDATSTIDGTAPCKAGILKAKSAAAAAPGAGFSGDRVKNPTPRERMRMRKQQEADKKAKELQEATMRNHVANLNRKAAMQASHQQKDVAPWEKSVAELEPKHARGAVLDDVSGDAYMPNGEGTASYYVQKSIRARMSPPYRNSDSCDGDDEDTDPFNNSSGITMMPKKNIVGSILRIPALNALASHSLSDNRPITPLKDKMIYDPVHSSLDFADGVPDDPQLAETYYSQYEEFDEDRSSASSGTGSDADSIEETLEQSKQDMYDMLGQLQQRLGGGNVGENSVTVSDDTVAGAFGPTVRSIKIRNLRAECEKKLGSAIFKKVYDYLKEARFDRNGGLSTMDESNIMEELGKYVKDRSACFLVDQLLFLEVQAQIEK